jgi:splicing factor 3A subunit 1
MPVEAQEAEMDVEMDEEERTLVAAAGAGVLPPQAATVHAPEPQMKIVRNYKRADGAGAGAGAAGPDSLKFVVSPITGELVPVDQMAEHMRISLIDPKWKEQKEIMMGKLRGSTVASDEEIAKNVIRLARTRPDIFGSTDEEVSTAVTAELESRKTAAAAPQPGLASHAVVQPGMRAVASMEGQPAGAARSGMQMPAPPGLQMPPAAGLPRPPAAVPPRPYGVSPYPPPMGMPMAPPGFTGAGALLPGPQPGMLGRPGAPLPPPGYAPPMPPYGMSAHGLPMPPLLPTDEPDAKRPRTEEAVIPEEDFAEAHPDPVTIAITVPDVDGEANLNGQTVSLEVASVMETVGDVKARLAAAIGVPASKQKLSSQTLGFLKDTSTLAAYNFGNGTVMIMGLKERGGRTKK